MGPRTVLEDLERNRLIPHGNSDTSAVQTVARRYTDPTSPAHKLYCMFDNSTGHTVVIVCLVL
jgi:hypothetical protein